MRINRLDLIRYGKFDGRSIDFPAAKQDFHLIVGPNEAGKSTLRSAILDLLFGIPSRSPLGFVHSLNELRLGAHICNANGSLEFQRAKALKQTLRTPGDAVLPDNALVPYLGAADRNFFDQMFGLDHTRLVQGGNSILSAENDVGQVLFQSAAGVASLGKIRDALMEEADRLWAPRKAANREYYLAADQLEKAGIALKEATVRTKVWAEAHGKLEALNASLAEARTALTVLAEKRSRLERVRRTAPYLREWRECEQQLAALSQVVELPADAAQIVAKSERELATAETMLDLHRQEADKARQELSAIVVDDTVLAMDGEITRLDERRLQYAAYGHDIRAQEKEIELLQRDIDALCAQLEWARESEDALAARLPTLLVRRELKRLGLESSGLTRALRAAEQAERSKQSEMEALEAQLVQLQTGEIKPALRAALAKARSLGDPDTTLQKQQTALDKARATLEITLQALGEWRMPVDALTAMQAPSEKTLSMLLQERQLLFSEHRSAATQRETQDAEVARIELAISQFRERHHPTTNEAVEQARRDRDASWHAIKTGEVVLPLGAPSFEEKLRIADGLADTLLEDVEEATELQSLQQQLAREKLMLARYQEKLANIEAEIRQFEDRWYQQVQASGLIGMSLDNAGGWLLMREKVLAAALACAEEERSFAQVAKAQTEYRQELRCALQEAHQPVSESDSLAVLCVQAEKHIQAIDNAGVRHETLSAQLKTAKTQADALTRATQEAAADIDRWNAAWETALAQAGLPAGSTLGAVEAALELIGQLEEKRNKVRQIRCERIDAMKADLAAFSADANRLAQAIDPHLAGRPAETIALELAQRLKKACTAREDALRVKETLHAAGEQIKSAQASIELATAAIKPLMERARLDSADLLPEAIAKSDQRRALLAQATMTRSSLLDQGDGMTLAQIEAEVDAVDLAKLSAELLQIESDHKDAVDRQAALTGELKEAQNALLSIGGSDSAARAEAQRQEALAQMSEAAERYVRVFTAGRLLRWSIDRYRQEKQGPLLTRASAIFAKLTRASFTKLVVDFEAQPMTLEGVRADGKLVGVSGMSDGTRDQLYLALRLAALELHLEQASLLPFIADDLFINYDDGRSEAGFDALAALSEKTQVIFLSHHDHLIPTIQKVFGENVNVVRLA